MIFSKDSATQQVSDLLEQYTGLEIDKSSEEEISLNGIISVHMTSLGFTLCKSYKIEVVISLYSDELPYVLDIANQIDDNYPHRYADGKLCLETDTSIRVRFIDGFSLVAWMAEYVEPYLFSYEYYQRYGEYPFGERYHGNSGILQTYSDFFHEADLCKTYLIMSSIACKQYRGHSLCPCRSGRKLRNCHGPYVMQFYTDKRLKEIVRKDYKKVEEMIKRYYEQR